MPVDASEPPTIERARTTKLAALLYKRLAGTSEPLFGKWWNGLAIQMWLWRDVTLTTDASIREDVWLIGSTKLPQTFIARSHFWRGNLTPRTAPKLPATR